jgi:hypothetical protein
LYDTDGLNVTTGHASVLQAWMQAESARIPVVVLVTDSRETGLTWPQVRRLADTVRDLALRGVGEAVMAVVAIVAVLVAASSGSRESAPRSPLGQFNHHR